MTALQPRAASSRTTRRHVALSVTLLVACEPSRRGRESPPGQRPPDIAWVVPHMIDSAVPVMPRPPEVPRPAPPAVPRDAPPVPPARVEFVMSEALGGHGAIAAADIDPALRTLAPEILRCVEYAAASEPRPQGVVELRFTLSESGRATSVTAADRTGSILMKVCVESRVRRTRFPSPHGGSVELLAFYRLPAG